MFINVKHLVVGWANNVFANACVVLLCQLVLKLFMCLFVQHDSSWRYVLNYWDVHRLHNGNMSRLRTCFLLLLPRYL